MGDRRRRYELHPQRGQPDRRAARLERRRGCSRLGGRRRAEQPLRPTELPEGVVSADRRAVPDVSMLADIPPGYAIYCTAATAGLRRPRIRGRRSAARAPRRRCSPAASRSSTSSSGATGREDLGLVNPLLYAARQVERGRERLRRRHRRRATTSSVRLGGSAARVLHRRPGFDDASGLGQRQPRELRRAGARHASRRSSACRCRCRATSARWRADRSARRSPAPAACLSAPTR